MGYFNAPTLSPFSNEPYDPHPRDLWMQQNLNYSRLCDENFYNHGIRIHNEYLAHASEAQRLQTIAEYRNRLLNTKTFPLDTPYISHMPIDNFPPVMQNMVKYINQKTYLDHTGAILAIAAVTAAACCGRIVIKITDTYVQPFILQMIGIAESGSRKSELKRICCAPINQWTNEANTDVKDVASNNAIKAKYVKDLFQQKGKKELAKLLKNSSPYLTQYEIDKIQEYVDVHVDAQERALATYAPTIEKTVIVDNATPARFIKAAEENGEAISLFSAEDDVLLQFMYKKNEELLKLVMRGYDHEEFNYQKYYKQYKFLHPSVSMMVLTQPKSALQLYANDYLKGHGLVERIIPWNFQTDFFANCSDFSQIMPDICEKYNSKIKSLLDHYYTQDKHAPRCIIPIESSLEKSVKQYLEKMRNNAYRMNYGRGWFAKAGARTIRLACAIHFWNSDKPWDYPINAQELNLGMILLNAISRHADMMFSPRGLATVEAAKSIMDSINRIDYPERQKILTKGYSSTSIRQRTGYTPQMIVNALDLLASCNHIAILDEGKSNVTIILRE